MKKRTLQLLLLLALATVASLSVSAQSRVEDSLKVIALTEEVKTLIHREVNQATKLSNDALKEAKRLGSTGLESLAYKILADCYYYGGDWEKSTALLDTSAHLAQQAADTMLWQSALNNFGIILSRMGELDKATVILEQCLKLNIILDQTSQIAKISNNLAVAYELKGELTKAKEYYHTALRIDPSNRPNAVLAHGNLRHLYTLTGQIDSALWHGRKAIKLAQSLGNIEDIADKKLGLAHTYLVLDYDEKALELAYEVKAELPPHPRVYDLLGTCHDILSHAYAKNLSTIDSAIHHKRINLELIEPMDTLSIVQSMFNLGNYFGVAGLMDSSFHYLSKAEEIAQRAQLFDAKVKANLLRANNYLKLGKFHTALEKANAALDFATEAGLDIYKPKIYESLHSIHDSLGNTALAYQYFQTYAQLKDSMFNSKVYFSAQELADQEALQDAKAVYSEKMAALNQSKQRVILLSVGTVLAALLLLIGVWRYYKNKEGATLRFLLSRLTAIGKAPSKQGNTSAPQPSLLGTGRMEELMTELQRLQVAVHNLGNTTPSPKEEAQLSQIVKEKMEYLEGLQFSISHDLKRYVLNLQNQLSGLVSRNQPLSTSEVAPVQKITEEMIQFMEQLKEIHRIDELSIQTTFINLQDLVKDILQQLSPEQNYPEVQIDFSSALPTVETDPLLARQVITNLLENALKYSQHSTQPKVEIGLIDKAPQTVLYIRDNGAGIPEEDQSRIFEPFFRSNHTKTEGTGLGLAISRIAAQKLGGELRVESQLGKGSTFYFAISA